MKKILLIIPIATLTMYCSSSKTSQSTNSRKASSSGTATERHNTPGISNTTVTSSTDTVIITGIQYIPIEGRSETGTRADLEGAWELDSLNGTPIPGRTTLNTLLLPKKSAEGSETRHDSTTLSETVNGVTRTTTTVLLDKTGTLGNKITPPQGVNFHIPAKPSINFYGSNETFSGFTGCNKFSGRYLLGEKNKISLQSAAASTKMVCLGEYDEEAFLNSLKRVNAFRSVNGQLELLEGNSPILIFSKRRQ